jgi:hypothetical protein
MRDDGRLGRMRCHDHEAVDRGEIEFSLRQGSCSISGSGVDADPRTIFMIDFNFNNLAALAVWSNNG